MMNASHVLPTAAHQKRGSVSSTSTSLSTSDKTDAALRAATLSFSPPFTRQPSDEVSVSPSKTNGTALIAARAIGAGSPMPRPLAASSPDRAAANKISTAEAGSVNPANTLSPSSPFSPSTNAGSLKAAQLSVSRKSSAASLSRAKSGDESHHSKTWNHNQDDGGNHTPVEGSLIAAKLVAQKKGAKTFPIKAVTSGRNDSQPSLLAAGLAVSRSTTPATMPSGQPERDQEPDILPPTGSVSEAKKRLLQQTDDTAETPVRGRILQEAPLRSKNSGTFSDPPPQSTANISPLSAAKLAVQHSGRSAGASSMGPNPGKSKPRQPSPIKKEITRDIIPNGPVSPPPKPIALKQPTFQAIKVIETPPPLSPKPKPPKPLAKKGITQNASESAPPVSPKPKLVGGTVSRSTESSVPAPSPKPKVSKTTAKKIIAQDTGGATPPPQPIKPLPRRARPPARAPRSAVPDTASPTAVSPGTILNTRKFPILRKNADPIALRETDNTKVAPPPPVPRGTKPPPETQSFVDTVKLEPPVVQPRSNDPVKQTTPVKSRPTPQPSEPVKQEPPIVKPKPINSIAQDTSVAKPKPEPPKPKALVDSIVNRQPASLYQTKNASTATLPAVLPPPPREQWRRKSSSGIQMLRQNHTGPDSTRPAARATPSWRDDIYDFSPPEPNFIRPSHTGDSLRHAIVASSLASSRAGSPVKSNPIPLPPRPTPVFRTTMRSPETPTERETSPHKKNHNLLGKKHPNKHNEGARKRWREFVTEKERKRYEGLWAANRGLHLTAKMFDSRPDARGKNLHQEAVAAIVVKDVWGRSRLPLDILEQIWELVDRGPRPKFWLTREEFIMGLWLIDLSLKGRKLPVKVQDGTWESVRKMGVVLKGYEELGLKDKKVKRTGK